MAAGTAQLDARASVNVATLKRREKRARALFNEAHASLLDARAEHRRHPSRATLNAVDDAERVQRRARREWNVAYDELEIAEGASAR